MTRLPQRVRPGQQLDWSAGFYNLLREMAEKHLRDRAPLAEQPLFANPNRPTSADPLAHNATGSALAPNTPVYIDALAGPPTNLDVTRFNWVLQASSPMKVGQVCGVTLTSAAVNEVVRVRTSGIALVSITVNHETHTHVQMADASSELSSGFGGWPIVWKSAAGTGSMLAAVHLGAYSLAAGKVRCDAVLNAGATANCTWVDVDGLDAGLFPVINWTGNNLDGTTTPVTLWVNESPENHELYAVSEDC